MTESLLSNEFQSILKLQGISTDTYVGVLDCKDIVSALRGIAGDSMVIEFSYVEEAVQGAKSTGHFVILASVRTVHALSAAIGPEAVVAIIAVGAVGGEGPSAASLRSAGAMEVVSDPTEASLRKAVRRGLEVRALRALELAHRCESQRLRRRELDLLGHPPEHMTDDLNLVQPPPLPVGPISTYELDAASEAFEHAYIDRVQHLCSSAREAALHLDVSAATLARRLRKEGES